MTMPYLDLQILYELSVYFGYNLTTNELYPALLRWQYEKLVQTLEQAHNNTLFYKHKLHNKSFSPKLQSLGNLNLESRDYWENKITQLLANLDFTTQHDLASNSEQFLAVSHEAVAGIISTSGTTGAGFGEGKRIYCTQYDLERTIEFFKYGMQLLITKQAKVALLMSGTRPGSVGDLLSKALQAIEIECYVMGYISNADEILENILQTKVDCLVGVPKQILALARHAKAHLLQGQLKTVLLSGDAVTIPLRQAIAEALGCKVFVHYGLTETGLGGAVECVAQHGCHNRDLDLLIEIVDEQDNQVLDTWGNVVITTLTRQAMPLIRYQTGDWGKLNSELCCCGSQLRRLEILGRKDCGLTLADHNFIHITQLDNIIYSFPWVQAYQVKLTPGLEVEVQLTMQAPEYACGLLQQSLASLGLVKVFQVPKLLATPKQYIQV